VTPAQAQQIRLGYGTGGELVEGYWRDGYTLPRLRPASRRRQALLAPQEQLAAILSGRSRTHPSEDLLLRARLDLDCARAPEAALQLKAAIEVLGPELQEKGEGVGVSAELTAQVQELAAVALRGKLGEEHVSALTGAIEQVQRIARQRRHRQG
jgi:hypothetical protein